MLSVDVRCRIDPKTKEDAAEVIESMGLTVSDAIRLFLTRVASEGAIPFELRVPNAKTVAAIAELESPKSRSKLKRHKNLDAMHDAIKRK
ncbi:MAG: type II toxin-antitoxin system RelB/DinJ family antitoxin [Burkholderiales bacterium]|jgi:DNA-damage-inducible protein J|nr:type II toxin-antitoxin system RelB/DinJ family antitoxin [Burkholderiales bacterium]